MGAGLMNALSTSSVMYGGAALICALWLLLTLGVSRGARWTLAPALGCAAAALWAGAVALTPEAPLSGIAGLLEVIRDVVWLVLLLRLCRRAAGQRAAPLARRLALAGGAATVLALVMLLPGVADLVAVPGFGSAAPFGRLGLALVIVLLAENLYRNTDESIRWHVNLPAIALGGLAAYDVALYAAAALTGDFSPTLLDARAALTAVAMPLLALAAARDRRWERDPPVSREVVFHGTTLVAAGIFLLAVGALGEGVRHVGAGSGRALQAGLLAAAIMSLAVAVTSRSVRSRLRRMVVDHFFAARYDYRREWLRCVAVLSAPDAEMPVAARAIGAVADPLDSPAGVLLLRDGDLGAGGSAGGLHWAGSWNLRTESVALASSHPLVAALGAGDAVVGFDAAGAGPEGHASLPLPADLRAAYGVLWLAVPLLHHRDGLLGAVLLAPPRAGFPLDREVFELLHTLGREVAMFLAERQAAERLVNQRRVEEYAKRFAFVAHDVKTVSSQLGLLLANAEDNLQDPEFQRDMLLTVRASAARIDTLIARLRQPGDVPLEAPAAPGVAPAERIRRVAAAQRHPVRVDVEGRPPGLAALAPERFDAAIAHLLNNAIEASGHGGAPVQVRIRGAEGGRRVVVDIIDQGPGMSPEFIRDELFRPLRTSKPGGSGIGAWQARELLREIGGDLTVLSRPGSGTTMRLLLPAAPAAAADAAKDISA